MRPLRKGATRTALAEGLAKLLYHHRYGDDAAGVGDTGLDQASTLQASVLGGAIVETCKDMGIDQEIFFRYTNENLWRLTRALKASGLLTKAGE